MNHTNQSSSHLGLIDLALVDKQEIYFKSAKEFKKALLNVVLYRVCWIQNLPPSVPPYQGGRHE